MNIHWQNDRALELVQLEVHTLMKTGIVDWSDLRQVRTLSALYSLRQITAFLDFYGENALRLMRETTLWSDIPFDDNVLAEIHADYCGGRPVR